VLSNASDVHFAAIQVMKRKHVTPPQPTAPAAAQAADAEVPPSTVKRRRMALERKLAGEAGDSASRASSTSDLSDFVLRIHTLPQGVRK